MHKNTTEPYYNRVVGRVTHNRLLFLELVIRAKNKDLRKVNVLQVFSFKWKRYCLLNYSTNWKHLREGSLENRNGEEMDERTSNNKHTTLLTPNFKYFFLNQKKKIKSGTYRCCCRSSFTWTSVIHCISYTLFAHFILHD